MDKSLWYKMDLNEVLTIEESNSAILAERVRRVPGGWVYMSIDKSHNLLSSTFIPFDNEFQESNQ